MTSIPPYFSSNRVGYGTPHVMHRWCFDKTRTSALSGIFIYREIIRPGENGASVAQTVVLDARELTLTGGKIKFCLIDVQCPGSEVDFALSELKRNPARLSDFRKIVLELTIDRDDENNFQSGVYKLRGMDSTLLSGKETWIKIDAIDMVPKQKTRIFALPYSDKETFFYALDCCFELLFAPFTERDALLEELNNAEIDGQYNLEVYGPSEKTLNPSALYNSLKALQRAFKEVASNFILPGQQ